MKIRNIIILFIATATIVGGLVIEFIPGEPLTWEELNTLIAVHNYEIEMIGGEIILQNVTKDNFLELLNAEIMKRDVQEATVNISGTELTKEDYIILRSGLVEKAKQKSLIEKLLK